jgi:hypothetical protein
MYLSTSPSPTPTLTPIGPDFGATREEAACEATEVTLCIQSSRLQQLNYLTPPHSLDSHITYLGGSLHYVAKI